MLLSPYEVPSSDELPRRLQTVLHVVYLVFTEGYAPAFGEAAVRPALAAEAIRLGRLLAELLPEPEVLGLLALMLLHDSRRNARISRDGELVLLADQDRTLWDRASIAEGIRLLERAMSSRQVGPYTLQAAIAAVHAQAPTAEVTNWERIVGLYDLLMRAEPSPVVELNRAVAVAMRNGPASGLELIDAILSRGDLLDYRLAHAARADLLRRMGQPVAAREAYACALELTRTEPERRFIKRRLDELDSGTPSGRWRTSLSEPQHQGSASSTRSRKASEPWQG
jgi:RNA polymerase sigma-70 factor (ECF subfamily)